MTWVVGNGHFLTLDAGLTLFLTLALCAVLLANDIADSDKRARRRWIWLAWAAMAGAVLSKGLVGIAIPGAVLVIVSVWRRNSQLWRGMHWLSGLLIFFVLAAPWFVLVSARNPILRPVLLHPRALAALSVQRAPTRGAWWYYIPLFWAECCRGPARCPGCSARARPDGGRPPISARDILLVWCVFIFLFFSASGSKLPSYILPMFPALALLVAMQLRDARVRPAMASAGADPGLGAGLRRFDADATFRLARQRRPRCCNRWPSAVRVGTAVFLVGAAIGMVVPGRRKDHGGVVSLAFCHLIWRSPSSCSRTTAIGQLKSAAT